MRFVAVLAAASVLLPASAFAQKAEPAWRVVGFSDRPGDCDPVEARRGRCIEFVDLWQPEDADGAVGKAWLRNQARLQALFWDELALRWERQGDGIEETLKAAGNKRLPAPSSTWSAAAEGDSGRSVASAPTGAWLDPSLLGMRASSGRRPALFHPVRRFAPPGAQPIAPLTRLRGRFAERLGNDGKPHPYELMDATPSSSAPFFEQVYPFASAMAGDDPSARPLLRFAVPTGFDALDPETRADQERRLYSHLRLIRDDWRGFTNAASSQFLQFGRAVGLQLLRFGLEEHTVNQMRVLAALTAMQVPPSDDGGTENWGRDLVAAAEGETDSMEDVEARIDWSVPVFDAGVRVRFDQLPIDLVERWIPRFDPEELTDSAFLAAWNAETRSQFRDLLRPEAPDIAGVTPNDLKVWAALSLRPGIEGRPIIEDLERSALGLLVERLPENRRDPLETWLLLDHVRDQVAADFEGAESEMIAPSAVSAGAEGRWSTVLLNHGYLSEAIPQGLGAVDPTAVCTTLDRLEALDEPTFGAINIDLIIDAPADARTAPEVLWSERERLPFLQIDDPDAVVPKLQRLVSLPAGRALFRVRWRVWSGWHVLWGAGPLGDNLRLTARTAAVCQDLVVTPPELVPTLTRAALLEADLFPSRPAYFNELTAHQKRDRRQGLAPDEPESTEDAMAGAEEGSAQASAAGEQAGAAAAAALADPGAAAGGGLGALDGLGSGEETRGLTFTQVKEKTQRLRDPIRPAFDALAAREGGLLLFAIDHATSDRSGLGEPPPRTPYERVQRRARKTRASSAGWGWYVGPQPAEWGLLVPDQPPGAGLESPDPLPRWRRGSRVDGWLMVGGAFAPWWLHSFSSAALPQDHDVVAPSARSSHLTTEGFGIDIAAAMTVWSLGRPRLAFELGPEIRLDFNHGGRSWFYDEQNIDSFRWPWTFRFRAGVIAGLRGLTPPIGLGRKTTADRPWGVARPDGTADLRRLQLGVRGGLLLGPGFNGVEWTGVLEGWAAGSIRRRSGPRSTLTPYNPPAGVGPFVRINAGFRIPDPNADPVRYLNLRGNLAVLAGIRLHLQLPAPQIPDAPATPGKLP